MNKILWLCLATLIATACKSNKETEPSSEPSQDKLIQVQPDVKKMKEAFHAFKQQRKSIKDAGGDRAQIQQARTLMTNQMMSLMNDQQKQIFTANAAKYDGILRGE